MIELLGNGSLRGGDAIAVPSGFQSASAHVWIAAAAEGRG